MIQFLVSHAVSLVIGIGVGWFFAHRSSKELKTVFRCFAAIAEEQGLAEWKRDKHGRITMGKMVRAKGVPSLVTVRAEASGSGIVTAAD